MKRKRVAATFLPVFLTLLAVQPGAAQGRAAAGSRDAAPPPVVIAVVESGGMNVLHSDYRLAPDQTLRLPPGVPAARVIDLPRSGGFEDRIDELKRGPLGKMEAGTLYRVRGTRIVGLFTHRGGHDLTADRFHATGTTGAAVGLKHGTNPDALLVYVADDSREAWEWLEKQRWIDLISTSYYSFSVGSGGGESCMAGPSIERISEQGRIVFSAIGNGEQTGAFFTPAGYPSSYQVGGVDDEGRTYRPDSSAALGPTRPYETGDRFSFPSTDADALTGSMEFGGTSGATPSTAGRAAQLISFARDLLGSDGGFQRGKLAVLGTGGRAPKKGPLADGDLTREELIEVMHRSATPAEPESPFRYLVEGYGAFQDRAVELAKRVLAGIEDAPERPEEDAMHEAFESARPVFFQEPRC